MDLKVLSKEARELFAKETLEAVRRWAQAQDAENQKKGETTMKERPFDHRINRYSDALDDAAANGRRIRGEIITRMLDISVADERIDVSVDTWYGRMKVSARVKGESDRMIDVTDNDPETLWQLADLLDEIAKVHESPREEMPDGE